MKKLILNRDGFSGSEVMTRTQLKNVMGGSGMQTTKDPNYCYNVCMAGYVGNAEETAKKAKACDDLCGDPA